MGYVAVEHLTWGDRMIAPGEAVPEGEAGRDYAAMLRHGLVREDSDGAGSDDKVRKDLTDARKRVKELEAAVDGPRLVLTDEQRELLAGKGLDGEFTLEQLDAALSDAEPAANEAEDDDDQGDELPDGVEDLGGGWYLLPDGETKAHGRKQLAEALAQ